MYVPLMFAQIYGPQTGSITSTHTVDDDGNVAVTPGGRPFETPGAPAAFKAARAARARDMGFATSSNRETLNGDTAIVGNHSAPKTVKKHGAEDMSAKKGLSTSGRQQPK
jgi:hypothetical protein